MTPLVKSQNVEAATIVHKAIKGVVDAYELTLSALAGEVEALRLENAKLKASNEAEGSSLRRKLEETMKELAQEREKKT
jgi:hypothetical protein